MTVAEIQARKTITMLTPILDDLPLAHAQLWSYLLPGSRRVDVGSTQRHSVFSHGNVMNLEAVDLLDTREKPEADPYRTNAAIEADRNGRRQGVLPTISQWVRLADDRMVVESYLHEEPYALLSCGPVCRFAAEADEVMLWPIYPGYACTEIERTHFRKPTVASHCRWLRGYTSWISDQEWAASIIEDLESLLREIRAIIGSDRSASMPCLTELCGGVAYARNGGAWYVCSSCERAWSRAELVRHAERNTPRTLIECAKLLSIGERSLRRYLAQELIAPIPGLRRGKSPLFSPREVDVATRSLRYRHTEGSLVG